VWRLKDNNSNACKVKTLTDRDLNLNRKFEGICIYQVKMSTSNQSSSGRGHGQNRINSYGGRGRFGKSTKQHNKTSNKSTNNNAKAQAQKQNIFEPYSVGSQQVDTYDSVLES